MFAVAEEKYIKQKYSDNFVFGTTFIIINENILDVIDRKVNIKGVFFVTFKLFLFIKGAVSCQAQLQLQFDLSFALFLLNYSPTPNPIQTTS